MMDAYRDEQIDRFINNGMQPEEHEAFRRELEADEELQKQVKLRALLAEASVREAEKEALQALTSRHPARRRILMRSSAAAIAAVLLGVLFFIGNSHRYTPEDIFMSYYEQPVIEPSRGESEVPVLLNIANEYLIQNRAQDAIALLTPEILQSEYSEEAEWLLLCAYLQTGERAKAEATARSIRQQDGVYAAKATNILNALNEKLWF